MNDNEVFYGLFLRERLKEEQGIKARSDTATSNSNDKGLSRATLDKCRSISFVRTHLLTWYQAALRPRRGSQCKKLYSIVSITQKTLPTLEGIHIILSGIWTPGSVNEGWALCLDSEYFLRSISIIHSVVRGVVNTLIALKQLFPCCICHFEDIFILQEQMYSYNRRRKIKAFFNPKSNLKSALDGASYMEETKTYIFQVYQDLNNS
jgi:hypothetical protein